MFSSDDKLIQVKLRYIPAIYPDESYTETYFYYNTYAQKLVEPFTTRIKTEKKHKTVYNNAESRQVLIQTQYFVQYEIIVKANETTAQELVLIDQARQLQIVDEYDNVFEAEYIEKSYEDVDNTKLKKITFRYRQRENDENAVSSHVENDILLDQFDAASLVELFTSEQGYPMIHFYSAFIPVLRSETYNKESVQLNNGTQYPVYECIHTFYECKFYLNDENLKLFVETLAKRQNFNTSLTDIKLNIQDAGYFNNVSAIQYEIVSNDELIDLNEVNFRFITAITENQY